MLPKSRPSKLLPVKTEKETWNGNPSQFFCATFNVHNIRNKDCLVHISRERNRSNIHFSLWSLPRLGAAWNRFGGMVAERNSIGAHNSVATRFSEIVSGIGRDSHF